MKSHKKTSLHNPFLIILFKVLIEEEVKSWAQKADIIIADIAAYVAAKPSYGQGDNIIHGKTLADRVTKLWSRHVYDFSVDTLDKMCELIVSYGPYSSWADFVAENGEHVAALVADKYLDKPFADYAETNPEAFEFIVTAAKTVVGVKKGEMQLQRLLRSDSGNNEQLYFSILKDTVSAAFKVDFVLKINLQTIPHFDSGAPKGMGEKATAYWNRNWPTVQTILYIMAGLGGTVYLFKCLIILFTSYILK